MIDLVVSPYQKENFMTFFRNYFKIGKNPKAPEIDVDSSIEIGRISLVSPRSKPPAFPSARHKTIKPSVVISPPKRSETMKPEYPESRENLIIIKELIEQKHLECIKLIESKFTNRKNTEEKIDAVFKEHHTCDQQEYALLNTIDYLLSEDDLEEALRVIRWRKKILKISSMNGWEVAQEIAKKTINKLDVTAADIMEANLKTFMTPSKSMALN